MEILGHFPSRGKRTFRLAARIADEKGREALYRPSALPPPEGEDAPLAAWRVDKLDGTGTIVERYTVALLKPGPQQPPTLMCDCKAGLHLGRCVHASLIASIACAFKPALLAEIARRHEHKAEVGPW